MQIKTASLTIPVTELTLFTLAKFTDYVSRGFTVSTANSPLHPPPQKILLMREELEERATEEGFLFYNRHKHDNMETRQYDRPNGTVSCDLQSLAHASHNQKVEVLSDKCTYSSTMTAEREVSTSQEGQRREGGGEVNETDGSSEEVVEGGEKEVGQDFICCVMTSSLLIKHQL